MTTGNRKFHDFCWINLMTPDLERAAAFYQRIFGWTYAEGVPGGHVILVDGLAAGALMDLAKCPPGIPPCIGVMIKVESADAAVGRVNALGGRAEPAFDVMGNGRMATCKDPNGGVFNVWQPLSKDGTACDSRAHGAPTWFETLTTDADRAVKFYTELFGWKSRAEQPAPGMTYTVLSLGEVEVAGAMRFMPDKMGNIPPHWATYFAVKNADETVRLAKELGAELCVGPHDIPKVGPFALMKSPQGVPFHVLQWAQR
jgi:predicted enzyme related to lactoylglutathione lyase